MSHFCDHGNRHCQPGALCTPCRGRGGVLQDGERVRTRMVIMDAMQRSVAASARQPEPVTEEQRRAIRAQAAADHYREQHNARQRAIAADPRLAAYHAQYQR